MKHKTLTDMYLDLKKQTPARMKSIEEKVKLVKKIAHVVITDSGKPQDPIIIQSRDLLCSWEEYQEELAIYGIKMTGYGVWMYNYRQIFLVMPQSNLVK